MADTEVDLAKHVVLYLQDQGWEVHQEVLIGGSSRADIVALGPQQPSGLRLVWIVEVKRSLTFDVVAQADAWRRAAVAHYVSIAVPGLKRGRFGRTNDRGRYLAECLCKSLGIGALEVVQTKQDLRADLSPRVEETVPPSLARRVATERVRSRLSERTLTGATLYAEAGNARGRYWSPFRSTCHSIRQTLKANGPLTTRDLVDKIVHHYRTDRSARGTLHQWMVAKHIPGVRMVTGSNPIAWEFDPDYREEG